MTFSTTSNNNDLLSSSFHGGGGGGGGNSSSSTSSTQYHQHHQQQQQQQQHLFHHRHHHHHHHGVMSVPLVPHRGSLCRVDGDENMGTVYTLEISTAATSSSSSSSHHEEVDEEESLSHHHHHHHHHHHELVFSRKDFEFALRLFSIMDTESRGQVSKATVQEFVTMRCPVFWRRDEDLNFLQDSSSSSLPLSSSSPFGGGCTSTSNTKSNNNNTSSSSSTTSSPTFEEVWRAVVTSSVSARAVERHEIATAELGVEGWMVFCRFIALAQYLEAKRRFSGRHLQQTMRHRNGPRGSELVVVVDVPPAAPPVPLTAKELALYEQENQKCLPLPELDLDHSLLAAHDVLRRRRRRKRNNHNNHNINNNNNSAESDECREMVVGHVKIDLFGPCAGLLPPHSTAQQQHHQQQYQQQQHHAMDFCLTYCKGMESTDRVAEITTVRRSMTDMKWLNDTFVSQKSLGGTLCGRILPPFPGGNRTFLTPYPEESSLSSATGGAIYAAANAGVGIASAGVGIASASVGMLKEGIKSLWGGYSTSSPQTSSSSTSSSAALAHARKHSTKSLTHPKNAVHTYYNPNSPTGQARHLERYLNYLLEHPALSTSFPLNTILKASQSGLEAAKKSLEEHTLASKAIKKQTPNLEDGKSSNFWSLNGSSSLQPNLAWVRTAAQAAVALQLHGVLETTGLSSASARLQHASLPNFDSSRTAIWVYEDGDQVERKDSEDSNVEKVEESFEEGVMHVEDGLEPSSDDPFAVDEAQGYDLLPLPVPAPERQILSVGEPNSSKAGGNGTRFRYGSLPPQDLVAKRPGEDKRIYLGEMAIDDDIDKLRDIIGHVDNTLSRCLSSGGGIERSRRDCQSYHLQILRDLDSWEGLRGKFVSQRALLKGVSGIEQSREVFEESDLALIDDISWQAALAHSAVSAAEDVRSTVRAARTATNAKATAMGAAEVAQAACEKGKFPSVDEARAAQTRASIAQSHAIHAAVVEHEAKTAKRRATLALAHDVKCWNVHRKREVLQAALSYAKSQHEATRRAVDAWACLRDGFVGANIIPSPHARRAVRQQPIPQPPPVNNKPENAEVDAYSAIFGYSTTESAETPQTIVAVEHELLKIPATSPPESPMENSFGAEIVNASPVAQPDTILPFAVADLITEENEDELGASTTPMSQSCAADQSVGAPTLAHSVALDGSDPPGRSTTTTSVETSMHRDFSESRTKERNDDEVMTSSMQSLVNGLMTWGGEDVEVDFALPAGMAASIAMEESGVFGNQLSHLS